MSVSSFPEVRSKDPLSSTYRGTGRLLGGEGGVLADELAGHGHGFFFGVVAHKRLAFVVVWWRAIARETTTTDSVLCVARWLLIIIDLLLRAGGLDGC